MMAGAPFVGMRRNAPREPAFAGSLRLNNQAPLFAAMSVDNPPTFYWQFERFWEVLAFLTFILGILAYLIAPNLGLAQTDGVFLMTVSIACVLQAIYFDRKTHEAARHAPET